MKITESQLRRYVRRQLNEQYQSYPLTWNKLPNDPRIPKEDMAIIQAASEGVGGQDATVEVTDDEVHISLFSPRGDTKAFLTHDLKTDTWSGSGPSEKETEMFGERRLDKDDVMDFAKNFGSGEGPIDRKLSDIGDFFSF